MDTGTIRFYFAPDWSSNGKADEYSSDMRFLEFGAWSENDLDPFAWLGVDATGSTLRLMRQTVIGPVEILQTPIQWTAGQWHQVALVWPGNGDVHLFLDGQAAATGVGLDFNAMNRLDGMTGFTVGSDLEGSHLAQGQFEELYTFSRACSAEELAWNWRVQKDRAALGPISEEELSERQLSLEATAQLLPETQSIPPGAALLSLPSCGLWLSIVPVGSGSVELTVHNTTPGTTYKILSRQDVAAGSWIEETTFLGAIGQTDTQVPISMNGRQTLPGLLGYEIDGYQDNCPNYSPGQNILPTLVTLGHSPWEQSVQVCGQLVTKSGYSDMTIYTAESGAQVFATGSMQWNWGLDDFGFGTGFPWDSSPPPDYTVSRVQSAAQQMTHNVLRTFSGASRVPIIFTSTDTTTSGDWSAIYQPNAFVIANWSPDSLPSYATSVTVNGGTSEEWLSQSGDPRAILEPGSSTERIAAAWTTTDTQDSSFTIEINLDGNAHLVAVYCVDWLAMGTLQRMEVFEASDLSFSNPLDTREVLLPSNGVYFVWNLSGQKVIRVTKPSGTDGEKAMVSGIFFGD